MRCGCPSSCRSRARTSSRSGRRVTARTPCSTDPRIAPRVTHSTARAGTNVCRSRRTTSHARPSRCSSNPRRRRRSDRMTLMLERPRAAPGLPLPRGTAVPMLEEAVASFWRHHSRRRAPLRSSVERLAELALASDPRIAAEGTRVLFERIVEPLCDGFTQRGADTYRRLFAQVVDVARRKPQCRRLDDALNAAGLRTERDLLRTPTPQRPDAAERARIRAVIVLSRLTLGADVAISMPLLRHAEAAFPNAEIAFVGTDAAAVVA